jgi:hypothetical protein
VEGYILCCWKENENKEQQLHTEKGIEKAAGLEVTHNYT